MKTPSEIWKEEFPMSHASLLSHGKMLNQLQAVMDIWSRQLKQEALSAMIEQRRIDELKEERDSYKRQVEELAQANEQIEDLNQQLQEAWTQRDEAAKQHAKEILTRANTMNTQQRIITELRGCHEAKDELIMTQRNCIKDLEADLMLKKAVIQDMTDEIAKINSKLKGPDYVK